MPPAARLATVVVALCLGACGGGESPPPPMPACAADGDCRRGFGCTAGECTPLPGNPPGAACTTDADCSSRACDSKTGTCQISCTRDAHCPDGATCFTNPVDTNGDGATDDIHPVCVALRANAAAPGAPCAKPDDCARGTCELGRCIPLCESADDCGDAALGCTGLFAMTDQGATKFKGCLPRRGVVDYDMGLGAGPLLGVPESAVSASLFIAEKRMDIGYYAGLSSLEDTNGFLYDVRTAYYSNSIRYQPLEGASFLVVSNSPLVALRPGTLYSFSPFAQTRAGVNSDYRVRALLKLHDAPFTSGHVGVHVFITDLTGGCATFNAANAAAILGPWEQQMRTIFAAASITIDAFTYLDSGAASSITVKEGAASPELDNLLQTATAPDAPGFLELVIVKRISTANAPQGFEILGIAGGIPAVSGIPGTPHSGAALALTSLCADKTQVQFALTAAHELGHALGLFHNVEQDGQRDQMNDNDGDGTSNLMYWAENGGLTQPRISPQQAAAMRANPVVR